MPGRNAIRTVNGHELPAVVSWLQKAVRRGLVDDALYCAVDMDLSGYGNYAWTRLKVIASEDVGLATPLLAVEVRVLFDTWLESKKDKNAHYPERLFLVDAVIRCCVAQKSRLVDNALLAHYITHEDDGARDIPDWVFDMHTAKGKREGRDIDHFYDVATEVHPTGTDGQVHPFRDIAWRGDEDPYEERVRELRKEGRTPPASMVITRDGPQREDRNRR